MDGGDFVRLAGFSGAAAVCLAAYNTHAFTDKDDPKLRKVFESGNKMHLIHSVALLGIPNTRRPLLVGAAMATGMLIFCGSCYFRALTGDSRGRMITPFGGMLLIVSWLLMVI